MAERKGKPIDAGTIAAAVGRVISGAIKGATDAWFGPGQPLTPVAPPEVKGRQLDYSTQTNITQWKPRTEQTDNAIDFEVLRQLADSPMGGFDLLRLAIETRKDQMAAQRWTIKAREDEDGEDPSDVQTSRARQMRNDLRCPDGQHTFLQWQRMILEDVFVIDAPACFMEDAPDGSRKLPQVMDGALLKRLIRPDGRTPAAPEPAFQQIIKGLPAVDYTSEELIYMPRNPRSHKLYGMSPVEQVVNFVNIAIRRALSQLEYYTAGSIPDMAFGVPEDWTLDQIKEFQLWWDSILSGNTEERRRARFIPGGVAPFPFKPGNLKDEYDEWIARIICYAFSLSPQAFAKQMNRATAETAKAAAQEEGLEPLKLWFKDYMDMVILRSYEDGADYEFVYVDEEIADPVAKATVFSLLVGKKPILTQDEARLEYGYEEMTEEQKAQLAPPPPTMALGPDGKPKPPALPGKPSDEPDADDPPASNKPAKRARVRTVEFYRDEHGVLKQAKLSEE